MQFLCCMKLVIAFPCTLNACHKLLINCVVFCSFDQFNKPGCINPDVQRQTMEALLASSNPAVENCMRPEFIRLAPPLHIAEDEVFKVHVNWWVIQRNFYQKVKKTIVHKMR